MVIGILFLLVSLLCLAGAIREISKRNFLGALYAVVTLAVFGWFSVMTILDILHGGGVQVGA